MLGLSVPLGMEAAGIEPAASLQIESLRQSRWQRWWRAQAAALALRARRGHGGRRVRGADTGREARPRFPQAGAEPKPEEAT